MNDQQLLRDPDITPTNEVFKEALGEAYGSYNRFIEDLKSQDVQVDWRFYKDGKAWLGKALYQWATARGTAKEMTVCWISIWDGYFKASIFIPEKARSDALQLPLRKEVVDMIEDAGQMGKLKYFPLIFDVRSDEMLDTIYTLIDFRKKIK